MLTYMYIFILDTGADPITNPTTLGSVAKVVGSWKKGTEMLSRL